MFATGEAWIVNEKDRAVLRAEIAAQLAPLTELVKELRGEVREDRRATILVASEVAKLQEKAQGEQAARVEGDRAVHARVGRVETWIRLLVLSGVGAALTGLVYLVTRKP